MIYSKAFKYFFPIKAIVFLRRFVSIKFEEFLKQLITITYRAIISLLRNFSEIELNLYYIW